MIIWGDPGFGADSSGVQGQLKSLPQQIQASDGAFAAILSDGSVVTWVMLAKVVTAVLCKYS